ncbi:caspase family protein [Streptomyces luteogriseus]|uniref:caspase family protein n=1 Tax=Streptomyces TaxID=1883 RepID=UPI000997653B|nr:caspase family protein [Streptomyces sp. NRRL S-475]
MTRRPSDAVRRTLVVGGTARYDHHAELPGVHADLDAISDVFGTLGYEAGHRLLDETCAGFRAGLSDWADAEDRAEDALVLYYSGHGDRDHERHYLLCRDSRDDRLAGTALATEDVVRIVCESGIRRLLLIIDTCYAGQGGVDAARSLATDLGARLSTTPAVDEQRIIAFSVITAARPHELAEDGAFTRALRTAINDPDLGGHRQPKLYLEQVVDRVNEILAEHSPYQHATWGTLPSGEGFSFIPNPRYAGDIPDEGMDLAEQRTWVSVEGRRRREELRTHFGPRGRGTDAFTGATGSYFTGRSAALAELIDWLDGQSPELGRCAVLTGRGGVGKSSLLGRLVLLADPLLREALPDVTRDTKHPRQQVHAAVHARHKLLEDVTAGIADAAGVAETDPDRLIAALRGRTEPLVLVVDALDEAGTAGGDVEPHRIAASLLDPLSRLPCVRLLVGTRPHGRDALSAGFACLDLEEPRWTAEQDIVNYARRLLLTPDGPGSVGIYTEATAEPVARAVSARAAHNYLIARLIARPLAHRAQPVDTDLPDWDAQLPELSTTPNGSAGPAFRWALHEQLHSREARGRALLTALAYAEGAGLPAGEVWRATAAAFTGDEVTSQDIRWILGSASAHIVEGQDIGPDGEARSVYRLYHESYAEELRSAGGPDAGGRIATALLSTVPVVPGTRTRVWPEADPYVRTHLSSHAAGSPLIDELALDPMYLLVAEPSALHRALRHVRGSEAEAARAAYERCAPLLREIDLPARAAQLRLSAVQSGAHVLAEAVRLRFPDLPWDTLWADVPESPYPFRAIGAFSAPLWDTEVLDISGTKALATAQYPDRLELWDIDTGTRLGQLPPPASPDVLALEACQETRAPWLLAHSGHGAEWDSTVEVFDTRTRRRVGPPVETQASHCALAEIGGTCVVGLLATDGSVQLIDAHTGSVLARLTSRMRTSGTERWERGSAHVLLYGLRHPQSLAMGVTNGRLVVAAAVGVAPTGRLRGHAEIATWSVDPGQDWRVHDAQRYRLAGSRVAALAVRQGHVLVSSDMWPRITGPAQKVLRQGKVTEWLFRRGSGPTALVTTDRGAYRVHAGFSGVAVTDAQGRTTNQIRSEIVSEVSSFVQLAAIPSGSSSADLLAWRMDGSSVQVRDLPLVADEGTAENRSDDVPASRAGLVVGQFSGNAVLARSNSFDPLCLLDPESGRVTSEVGRGSLGGLKFCGSPETPIVAYQWLRRWRALHWVRVYEGDSHRRVRLRGGFLKPVTEMRTTSCAGMPLLVGVSAHRLTAWDIDGMRQGSLPVSHCSSLRSVSTDEKALLSVVDQGEQVIRVFELPDFVECGRVRFGSAGSPNIRLGRDRHYSYAHALGVWDEVPVLGYADLAGRVHVASVFDSSLEWRWQLPQVQQITHLALTTVEGRGAAIVCASDGTVTLVEAISGHTLCQAHLGAMIRTITVIDEEAVGLTTEGGLFCLRLTPRPRTM